MVGMFGGLGCGYGGGVDFNALTEMFLFYTFIFDCFLKTTIRPVYDKYKLTGIARLPAKSTSGKSDRLVEW